MLKFNLVSMAFCKLFQDREKNLGSLSDAMLTGMPFNRITACIYNQESFTRDSVILIERKRDDFVN